GHRDVGDTVDGGHTRRDDLPVRLHGNGTRRGVEAPEIGGHQAAGAEAGVEGAAAFGRRRLTGDERRGQHGDERQECERLFDKALHLHVPFKPKVRRGDKSHESERRGSHGANQSVRTGVRKRRMARSDGFGTVPVTSWVYAGCAMARQACYRGSVRTPLTKPATAAPISSGESSCRKCRPLTVISF